MRCRNSRPYAASAIGGSTSTRVTRPSTETQNFTWYVRPATEPGTLASGGRMAVRGEAGYIFPASPRTAILPPLARVPGSVAGRTYHVKFWVSVEGRVTRVEVEPPMADAAYGREFRQRMMAYQFYPAHTRDGRNVTYVVMVPLRIGN